VPQWRNVLAALIGALVGLGGVAGGAWLQGRREHERWLRNEKLIASVSFIAATGGIYDKRRLGGAGAGSTDDSGDWSRAHDARSALYLLCESATVDVAEQLVQSVRRVAPAGAGGHHEETLDLLRTSFAC